jgi:hypothetical protein
MLPMPPHRARTLLGCCLLALLAAPGCELKTSVRGAVVDVRGERLPGVAVTLRGTDVQAVTGGTGEYALRCPAGAAVLDYSKTGYTPARLDLVVPESGAAEANDVRLWPLPAGQGVYLFEAFRYHALTRTEPRPYRVADRGAVWASRVPAERKTTSPQPLLIYYLLPSYDAVLHRMRQADAALPQTDTSAAYTEPVWVTERQIGSMIVPVDEPDRLLFELRPTEPLEPGVYGVSWGAFDGYMTTHANVYLIEVLDPADMEETEVVPPDANAAGAGTEPPAGTPPAGATPADSDDSTALEG